MRITASDRPQPRTGQAAADPIGDLLDREGNRLLLCMLMMEARRERMFRKRCEELVDEMTPLAEWPLFVQMTKIGLMEPVVELFYERGARSHTNGGPCVEGM